MAYVGGKSKCFQHITTILNDPKYDNMDYIEPFVGYAHILRRVVNKKSYTASDNNPLLITLLKYIQKNNEYPNITKAEYTLLKNSPNNSIEKAFAAFTYSYNGKEWGGFTETNASGTRNYPNERKRYYDTLRLNSTFMNSSITCKSYLDYNPKGALIYCDPPYKNTTGYTTSNDFDHEQFWNTMRKWSKHNIVFISEYTCPDDFIIVSQAKKYSTLSGKGSIESQVKCEKLFKLKP